MFQYYFISVDVAIIRIISKSSELST